MKTLLLLTLALTAILPQSFSQVVWNEDFTGVANNATVDNGSTAWSVITPPSASGGYTTFQKQNNSPYGGSGESFIIRNTGSEAVWRSENIDISAYGIAIIDISIVNVLTSNSDYLRVYYQTNNGSGFGPETLLTEVIGTGVEETIGGSAIIKGQEVRIIVRANENSYDGWFIFFPIYSFFVVDDITVTGVETLYSRKNGNWNDATSNSSWSTSPITSGLPGASCGCLPDNNKRVVIQNGHTIDLNVSAGATIVEVESGGTLRWPATSRSLSLYRGGYVINNGTINRNGRVDARLVLAQPFNYTITSNNNNFTLDDIQFATGATATFNGSGSISLSDELIFSTGGASLNNYSTLTFTALNAGGNNITLNNYGTINQSEGFSNGSGSDLYNRSGGTWNWTYAGGTGSLPPTSLDCSAVGNTFNYAAGGDQGVRGMTYQNVTFSGSGEKRTNGNLDINGDLLISGSARLNVDTGDDNITIAGDWTTTSSNGDPLVQGSGSETVTFDGSGNQTFAESGGSTFNRLIINKPGGRFVLGNNITINNGSGTGLTLTRGIIQTSASALLIISDGATTNAGDADSFVDGPIRKIGNQEYTFPTGSGSRWAPIRISNFAGGTGTAQFTAQYFPAKYSNTTTDATLSHVSWAEYWTLDRNASTQSVSVTLHWQSALSDITNLNDLRVARFNGTTWVSEGNAARSGNTTTGTVRSSTITNFSPFTFGSFGGINPLPVELTDFSATLHNDVVNLKWSTATELNNDYFTIERATNLEQFEAVGQVEGKGTTNEAQQYSITDQNPLHGRSYYRLKQTDYDGTITYSNLQVIDYEGPTFAVLHTYPNPGTGKTLTIELKGLGNVKQLPLQIFNAQGVVVYQRLLQVDDSGSIQDELTFTNTLPPGIYIVMAGKTHLLISKIVIQ
ncbi:MAG TPA: T9SS type A sorting domain-containing protein [Ohtaekwangia sp.]|nr:T9SS type A sorting domain-containing protein [Ohtaekwangia sp.]